MHFFVRANNITCKHFRHSLSAFLLIYRSITVWMSIATATVPFLTHIPLDLRIVLGAPYVALQNIMMCRVYRQLKLGLIVDYDLENLNLDTNVVSLSPGPS